MPKVIKDEKQVGVYYFEETEEEKENKLLKQKITELEQELSITEADNINTMLALTEVYEMLLGGV